ncbi:MAG: PspC domain-containing protein [Acidimicrobiia bacterium]
MIDEQLETPPADAYVPVGLVQRHPHDQVISGLAAGIAERVGIEAVYVRAAFVALTLVWGVGLLLYLGVWAATSGAEHVEMEPRQPIDRAQRLGLVIIGVGSLLTLRAANIWPGDGVVWPSVAMIFGAAFLLDRQEVDSREAILRVFDPTDGKLRSRTVIGVVLLVIGLALFGSAAVPNLGSTVLAVIITGVGVTLVFGPWMWRLAEDLGTERRERIRQEERAEMAAHLHDSVLQTLALIQRTDDSKRMVTLARAQERELRKWLYERVPDSEGERLSDALQAAADRIEADFDIPVEVVTVGDAPLDDRMRALAGAAGEALTNAAKHAGVSRISLFVEATDALAEVFVTDQGAGFDINGVNGDRRGIADSIIGRMDRHGGKADIHTEPGEGTEVHLSMPRESP